MALLLFLGLTAALGLDNYAYFFHTPLYEFEDLAINSLQIGRAKHFHELYGQYSRWGFHHPGPAFFYVQAWGEMVFYDWLRVVPRPLNGQMLISLLLNTFFIATMLAAAVDRLGRRTLFLPLALLLGALHVAAIKPLGALFLIGNWPDYTIIVPFAALIVVGASVAAGQGRSLPLLVLICCILEHGHVAQPLFIVPLALLAYAGLVFACCPEARDGIARDGFTGRLRKLRVILGGPYRTFPRAHWLAAAIVAVFLLPILLDACLGSQSNLALILAFRHAHQAEKHKGLLRSFLYFVQFALYGQYDSSKDAFGDYNGPGMMAYFLAHRFQCEIWIGSLVGSLAVMLSWLRRPRVTTDRADSPEDAAANGVRRRYVVWLWVFVASAFGLTLVWGRIMNGAMLYYNAYFNYGLCYAAMLAVAAVASEHAWRAGIGRAGYWTHGFLYAALAALCLVETEDFRIGQYACHPAAEVVTHSVDAALAAEPASTNPRLLSMHSSFDLMRAVEVALELERRGVPFLVAKPLGLFFGSAHEMEEPSTIPAAPRGGPAFQTWRILGSKTQVVDGVHLWPLDPERALAVGAAEIDPAAGAVITFVGEAANYVEFAPVGWVDLAPAAQALWSSGPSGRLSFRPHPVPPGTAVRVEVSGVPFVWPGKLEAQRVEINFNGVPCGGGTLRDGGVLAASIPAAVWNARPEAWLSFRYLDATSPFTLGVNDERQALAVAFRQISFRLE